MKPQDIIFFITLAYILWRKKPRILVFAAVISLALSIPLFATWTFFTAERLTWYAVGYLASYLVLSYLPTHKKIR